MKRSVLAILVFVLYGVQIWTQSSLVAEFNMNDCQLTNGMSTGDGVLFGGDLCGCGVISNGISFDGSFTEATFDTEIGQIFQGDWSMTFYARIDNQGDETADIFFLGENCGRDSVFSVRYFVAADRFRVRLSDSPNNEVQLDAQADPNTCWQYVGIVKEGSILRLYINGVLLAQDAAVSNLSLNVSGNLKISGSPCLIVPVNPDSKFLGRIDELKIYNTARSDRQIAADNRKPDQIVTNDTTIFLGSSLQLLTGGTCSSQFSWSPSTFLVNANDLNPRTTPTTTTTYNLTINDGSCQAVDQVKVSVVSRDQLGCEDLLLPNVFTPNDDRINDTYGISNRFIIDELKTFEIFNRWGGRVFFSDDVDGVWDGRYKGEVVAASSFVYLVTYVCGGEDFSKSGTLHVIR